ncbi:hypothetical protein CQ12_00845 [Bradyrhizobium jicamae]|uniref:Uncharacterized protein n=1 Tax=Bradyrhizobium jicamae TaxID=280332 RepID=A0A0R3LNT1_9BRAD|nr:hypothetical protein CQ12_00845 [Bradyrhizobium jicamae]
MPQLGVLLEQLPHVAGVLLPRFVAAKSVGFVEQRGKRGEQRLTPERYFLCRGHAIALAQWHDVVATSDITEGVDADLFAKR